jgi:hypothetical protein
MGIGVDQVNLETESTKHETEEGTRSLSSSKDDQEKDAARKAAADANNANNATTNAANQQNGNTANNTATANAASNNANDTGANAPPGANPATQFDPNNSSVLNAQNLGVLTARLDEMGQVADRMGDMSLGVPGAPGNPLVRIDGRQAVAVAHFETRGENTINIVPNQRIEVRDYNDKVLDTLIYHQYCAESESEDTIEPRLYSAEC